MDKHRYDFSFSGLKTAVARHVELAESKGEEISIGDVAASREIEVLQWQGGELSEACVGDVPANTEIEVLQRQGGEISEACVCDVAATREMEMLQKQIKIPECWK